MVGPIKHEHSSRKQYQDNTINEDSYVSGNISPKSSDMGDSQIKLSPISAPSVNLKAQKNHSVVAQHSSFKNKAKYAVMNELEKGAYFGEISILTNLTATASIHTVNNIVCGRLNKQALLDYFLIYHESKQKMMMNMYKYNDAFFNSLSKCIKNIRYFKNLSHKSIMNLIFKMKKVKYTKNTVLIRDKEK